MGMQDVENNIVNAAENSNELPNDGQLTNNGSTNEIPELERPKSSGITGTVVFSTLTAASASFIFGLAVGYSSPAQSAIMKELGLTKHEYAIFSSILTIGALVASIVSGKIADFMGRKAVMGLAQILYIFGWLIIAFSKVPWTLYMGRFLLGLGMGLVSFVVPIYIAEITSKNVRGRFTLMISLGQSLAFLIGCFVKWRALALIGGLIQFAGLFYIPESPRWLASVGQVKEFEIALLRLRGSNSNISEEASEIMQHILLFQHNKEDGRLSLFQRKYMLMLTVGVGLMAFQRLGGLYASSIFKSAGFLSTTGSIAAAIIQIVSNGVGALLVDKWGRRTMLLISLVGSCMGSILTGLAFIRDHHCGHHLSAIMVFSGVLLYLGFFSIWLGRNTGIVMSEIFPINIKGAAGSLVVLVSWIGSWIIAYTYCFLFQWSSAGTFFIYGSICAIGLVFTVRLVPETRGRTLEDIQKSLICNRS